MTTKFLENDRIEQVFFKPPTSSTSRKYMDRQVSDQISEAIFLLIPGVSRLRDLFLGWSSLEDNDRQSIDEEFQEVDLHCLYTPLRKAMIRYEKIQDTEGAPGCEPGLVSFSSDPQLEEGLSDVIRKMEEIIQSIHNQNVWRKNSRILIPDSTISEVIQCEQKSITFPIANTKLHVRSASLDDINRMVKY